MGVEPECGEWEASRGGQISIVEEPVSVESMTTADVVLFPAERLGDLVDAGVLATISNAAVMPPKPPDLETEDQGQREPASSTAAPEDTFQYMDFAPAYREQVTRYGSDRLALPYGGSALVLVYRRDAFESKANKSAAREAGLTLEAPSTWTKLDSLAKFFQDRDWNGDGQPEYGIAVALGADAEGVGDASFLARGEPGTASRPVLVLVRLRYARASHRHASLCAGARGIGGLESARPARHGAV